MSGDDGFQVGGIAYRAGKMNAIKQFHVMRRLLPVLAPMLSDLQAAASEPRGSIEAALPKIAEGIAALSDENAEFVLGQCLAVVQRQRAQGTGWDAIWNVGARRLMFEDIDLSAMLMIVAEVIGENLSGFFGALGSLTGGEGQPVALPS